MLANPQQRIIEGLPRATKAPLRVVKPGLCCDQVGGADVQTAVSQERLRLPQVVAGGEGAAIGRIVAGGDENRERADDESGEADGQNDPASTCAQGLTSPPAGRATP